MSYQQLIAGKVKLSGLAGIQHHLLDRERVKTNPNIDLTRSHLNHSIEDLSPEHLIHRVKERIAQLHLKKRPRSDAVGIEDIIVSASVDFMLQLDYETREKYFRDSLHFFQRRYGKQNVMYCQCHLDESNPHIHIGVVPITPNGRLSAKSLFCPKTLEQLQTDFHREVSQYYGLERGEHHAKKYLPLQQFKAQQAKIQAQLFADDLNMADICHQKIKEADQAAHFPIKGVIFTSEDRDNIELPIQHYLYMKSTSEESSKMAATIHSLQDENRQLKHDEFQARSDSSFFLHKFQKLEKETATYSAIPPAWRKNIDHDIEQLQRTFSAYCHDLHRATVRVFLANKGDFKHTKTILQNLILSTDVKDTEKYIHDVIRAAVRQHKKNIQPTIPPPSWKPSKPSETDYTQPDETGIVPLQLSRVPDINWDMINWDLLSSLDKEEIHKKIKLARWL
ncbi:MAG: plasmid recombination protein [Selenomonadaceae bacterium]|nr:plasmid recombination protein [Selenomonadaceae bacterium]